MEFYISINENSVNKNVDWGRFHDDFIPSKLTREEIIDMIQRGHAIAALHSGKKKQSNFISAQHVCLDFDDIPSIESVINDNYISRMASFSYTTPSHTDENPRLRTVFLLEEEIEEPELYRFLVQCIMEIVEVKPDQACKDPSRGFFGSLDCTVFHHNGILTSDEISTIRVMYEEMLRESEVISARASLIVPMMGSVSNSAIDGYVSRAMDDEIGLLRNMTKGGRHNQLIESAMKMFSITKSDWCPVSWDHNRARMLLEGACHNNGLLPSGMQDFENAIRDAFGYAEPREAPGFIPGVAMVISDDSMVVNRYNDEYMDSYSHMTNDDVFMLTKLGFPNGSVSRHKISVDRGSVVIPLWTRDSVIRDIQYSIKKPYEFRVGTYPVLWCNHGESSESETSVIVANPLDAMVLDSQIRTNKVETQYEVVYAPKIAETKAIPEGVSPERSVIVSHTGNSSGISSGLAKLFGIRFCELPANIGFMVKHGMNWRNLDASIRYAM